MRILFANDLYDATLSADSENANYPVTNLQNDSLKKIFKAEAASVVITATLAEVEALNCVYIGYTNASAAVAALYDESDVLLKSVTLSPTRGGLSFASTSDVSYLTLTLAGSADIYLGGFGFGLNYSMPDPNNDLILKPIDNTTINYSNDGQLYQNHVDILHEIDATYSFQYIDTFNEILAKWEALRHPVWVEPYEENIGMINPMWCKITMDDSPTQTWGWYAWAHNYREVR